MKDEIVPMVNKFPCDYIFQLDGAEFESLKSKILISNNPNLEV